jgi:sulfate adenylyltransferase
MSKFNLNQNQFSDLVNITNNVFYPLTNFVNKADFENIIERFKVNNKFFTLPIFFGMNKKNYDKYKKQKNLDLFYKSNLVAKVENLSFFTYDKKKFGKKIYGNNYKKHPFYQKFKKENYRFIRFDFKKVYKLKLNKNQFISPLNFIKKIKTKSLSSFHTRNVPHTAHQWIHKLMIKKYKALLIHPLIGQFKSGEYKDKTILNLNIIASKSYKNKNVHVIPFFSYPRYAGPREAAFHAIVRRNYGCTHFWVGRDHAGYKKFYNNYDSQFFCKKYQKNLKINILSEKEPYYCSTFKKIVNSCKCRDNCKTHISGTKIRKMIIDKKKIPKIFMLKTISKYLKKDSLIS